MAELSVMETVREKGLVFDGAMGTMLISAGLKGGMAAESWLLERPEEILRIHREYAEAGADIITTATFGGNPIKLEKSGLGNEVEQINATAAALARETVGNNGFVAGNIGPTGELLFPSGPLSVEDAEKGFAVQAGCLADGGVDLFLVQTFFDLNEILAAVRGIQSVSRLPIFASMTFRKTPKGFATVMGNTVGNSMCCLKDAGAAVIGANCSLGSNAMAALSREIRSAVAIPVMAKPNAGVPRVEGGMTRYTETAPEFAANMARISSFGVEVIGGCCGTTPEYIRLMKQV